MSKEYFIKNMLILRESYGLRGWCVFMHDYHLCWDMEPMQIAG